MRIVGPETCPLPDAPALAEVASALNAAGAWGLVVDREWRLVYMTDDIRLSNGALRELVPLPLGAPYLGKAALDHMLAWSGGVFDLDDYAGFASGLASWLVADGAEVDPRLQAAVAAATPDDRRMARTFVSHGLYTAGGTQVDLVTTALRVRDESGTVVGTALTSKPAAGMAVLGTIAAAGDQRHFARMQRLAQAGRRPAAILFGDLEASSPLARRLSTASYFRLTRRLVRAADQRVVDAGGMVGRHAGDGIVAFFLAADAGSESGAARACIEAMRGLRADLGDVAARSGLAPEDVVLRFGLHWGATLHIGQIATAARTEVDALGDEVNETARIEACAAGGRALASKALLERLDPADADAVGLDPAERTYTALSALATATEKARRDAPALAVCEV